MSRTPFHQQACSVAQALNEIGEWWTLLILREAFFGTRRFTDFQARLGIASNILTARLNKLVEVGVLTRHEEPGRGNPRVYRLTDKGRDAIVAIPSTSGDPRSDTHAPIARLPERRSASSAASWERHRH